MIIDLHCDLLSYLAKGPPRTIFDSRSRCSLLQLKAGGVKLQFFALFSEEATVPSAREQLHCFKKELIPQLHPIRTAADLDKLSDGIGALTAIEGGETIAPAGSSLAEAFRLIEKIEAEMVKIGYISLTWNHENRFGGGAHTGVGLKEEGRELLRWLDGRRIPVDLSHASDPLAYDLIEFIDSCSLKVPLIASHSNAREVVAAPRNLPDELIVELCRRRGLIGLNLVRSFAGPSLLPHIEHIMALGGGDSLCLGADFFDCEDFAALLGKRADEIFSEEYGNASAYPALIREWGRRLPPELVGKIAYGNAFNWMRRVLYGSETAA